jgi:hypothetical protein
VLRYLDYRMGMGTNHHQIYSVSSRRLADISARGYPYVGTPGGWATSSKESFLPTTEIKRTSLNLASHEKRVREVILTHQKTKSE